MIGHIFKYELPLIGEPFQVQLPDGYAICDIQAQGNVICLWAMIDSHAPFITETFQIYGTGWKIDDVHLKEFLKTVVMPDGLVWHVFLLPQ